MTLRFRFYAELNDFLPRARRQVEFAHSLEARASVKDVIEALGVPHPEVELILANGTPVDFDYLARPGDRLSVYPPFAHLQAAGQPPLRPPLVGEPRFVLDTHLGTLAGYLRRLGFDSLYRNDYRDEDLARLAGEAQRILLSKDRGLLKRRQVTYGYCVRSTDPEQQVREVLRRFDLRRWARPFRRCLRCNGELAAVDKARIADRVPAQALADYDAFCQCGSCRQVYWPGSHYDSMQRWLTAILRPPSPA